MLRGAKAILFDFDDTLVASSVADAAALASTLESFPDAFNGAALAEVRRHHDQVLADVKRVYHATGVWSYPPERLARLLRELGGDPALAPAMAERYYAVRMARLEPYPGARELLARLRARGLRLALVTNGPARTQRKVIARLGFLDAVDAVAIAGDEGVRKPDARLFEIVRDRLGVAFRDTVVVGDSYEMDMAPARALGMRAVYVAGAPGDARSHIFDNDVTPPPGAVDAVVARAIDIEALFG